VSQRAEEENTTDASVGEPGISGWQRQRLRDKESYVKHHAKAPSAVSTERKSRRHLGSLLAVLALALCALGSGASSAAAATPVMGTVTKVFSTSAHLTAKVENPVGPTYWRFDYSTDETNWVEGPEGAHGGPISPGEEENVTGDFSGLAAETEYFVRFAVYDEGTEELTFSAGPNPSFTTTAAITQAPTVLATDDASEVGFSTAKVTGELQRPGGANEDPALDVICSFEYITDAAYLANPVGERFSGATPVGCQPDKVIKAPGASNVEAILPDLTAETTYHLRLVATNGAGTDSKEASATFTTQSATAPVLALDPAANVKYTEAQISGTIDPEGGNTNPIGPTAVPIAWTLQYELASEPGNWQTAEAGTIEGPQAESSSPITVGPAQLANLTNGSEYKFRLIASYAGKEAISSEGSFATEAVIAPSVTIDPVTTFDGTTAHFSGSVNPNGSDPAFNTAWHFQCVPACGEPGGTLAAGPEEAVSFDVSGLEPNTSYEVKLVGSNPGGSDEDGPVAFKTLTLAPFVQTGFASEVEAHSATLAGKVNPHNSTATYQFEYGLDESYGTKVPVSAASLGTIDNANHEVTVPLTGLQEDTTYHFRLTATNTESEQTTDGVDHTFTTPPPAPSAVSCANAQLRAENNSLSLPDCRAYEKVSPAEKSDQGILYDHSGSSPSGNAISYAGSAAFGGSEATGVTSTQYVGTRGSEGWSVHPLFLGTGPVLEFLPNSRRISADATEVAIVGPSPSIPGAPSGVRNLYLRNGLTGAARLVTTAAPPNPGLSYEPQLGAASTDFNHVAFTANGTLTPGAPGTVKNVYRWDNGQLQLASILPGPGGGPAAEGAAVAPAADAPSRRAMSADGSRLFFVAAFVEGTSDFTPRSIYLREGNSTTQINASQRTPSLGEPEGGLFWTASSDGAQAFFTSSDRLTNASESEPGPAHQDLYRYDAETHALTDLTPVPGGAGVGRVVGDASADGSYVYFVAQAQLDGNHGVAGENNLYVWHEGEPIRFIASAEGAFFGGPFGTPSEPARLTTPDGRHLTFTSAQPLTNYPNEGSQEVYSYDADSGSLNCISCNPSGTPADDDAALAQTSGSLELMVQSRRVSDDAGDRIFFESSDALVAGDSNGVQDVYEWEADGTGSCRSTRQNGGCIYLISSGTSSEPSYFADASADGRDVFFTTFARLTADDEDSLADLYDARVDGGFTSPAKARSCAGEACRGSGAPRASAPSIGSMSFAQPPVPSLKAAASHSVKGKAGSLKVTVSEAGTLVCSGTGLAKRSSYLKKAGTATIKFALSKAAARTLEANGTYRTTLKLSFGGAKGRSIRRSVALAFKSPPAEPASKSSKRNG
jgi:hypothetical protein